MAGDAARRRWAAGVGLAAWGLSAVAVVTLLAARPAVTQDLWFFLVDITVACVYGTVSAVILQRKTHPVPVILALTALGGGLAALGFAYGSLGERTGPLPSYDAVVMLSSTAWVPGTLALFLVVPWLVRNSPLTSAALAGAGIGGTVAVVFTVVSVFDLPMRMTALAASAVAFGALTTADVIRRWMRGPIAERAGLGWLAIGTATMTGSFVPLALPAGAELPIWVIPALHLTAQAFYPAAILVSVLRQRMWGLNLAISRGTVAAVLTFFLVFVYVAVTVVVTRFVPGEGYAQILAAAVVAVAVQPSRLWVQRRVHRLVYGYSGEPGLAARAIGRGLSLGDGHIDTLRGLVATLASALRLRFVEVSAHGLPPVSFGVRSELNSLTLELSHAGRTIGQMQVAPPSGESLDTRSRALLDELSSVVAAAVALARAQRELSQSRNRLTAARLQERRVIRREIHDGLGPSLAGIRLALHALRSHIGNNPQAAAELANSLVQEVDRLAEDARTLSRSLLPPILEDLGLAAALDDLAERQNQPGITIAVAIDSVLAGEQLPDATASAIYGICAEALHNVSRHSGADRCEIAVTYEDSPASHVLVTVTDNGAGIAGDQPRGVGLRTMRERAEEQGGMLVIESAEPGTRVTARLPIGVFV